MALAYVYTTAAYFLISGFNISLTTIKLFDLLVHIPGDFIFQTITIVRHADELLCLYLAETNCYSEIKETQIAS